MSIEFVAWIFVGLPFVGLPGPVTNYNTHVIIGMYIRTFADVVVDVGVRDLGCYKVNNKR